MNNDFHLTRETRSDTPPSAEISALLNGNLLKHLADEVIMRYESMGLSESYFCKIFSISRTTWKRMVNGEAKKFDTGMLIKIANFLDMDVENVIKMYLASTHPDESDNLKKAQRNILILKHFDIKNLKKIGFIKNATDFDHIEERILTFFGFDDLRDYLGRETFVAYSKTALPVSEKMLRFWNQIVAVQLERLHNPHTYDEKKLLAVAPKMRFATLDEKYGFALFRHALYECGVSVIVESYLPKIAIRGGTFVHNGKPVIVITNFRKSYPGLWFALAHEIHHVIADLEEISRQGYHLSGTDNLLQNQLMEKLANDFARKLLISDENLATVERCINVDGFAELYSQKWNVHPSIIYGLYLWGKARGEHLKYAKYLIRSTEAIRNIEEKDVWKNSTIKDSIPRINAKWNPQTKQVELAKMPM